LSIVGVLADGFMVDGARTSTAMEMVLTTPGTNERSDLVDALGGQGEEVVVGPECADEE